LLENQEKIENQLAEIHLKEGALVLYDVTSTYLEGMACELAKYGYNRDKKKGKTQIIFGLLCDGNGCPIAVEVFEGNTKDSSTISSQIEKVRTRFGIKNVVWVTDRGILINSKINELVKPVEGLDYITGLTKPQIRRLAEVKAIQLGLFDQVNLVEFTSEDYPAERLIACRNPLIAAKNNRTREALLLAVESELNKIVEATKREKKAFRCYKSIDLKVRPIYHYKDERVKAHIFLCMLAYYVEWHLKQELAPLLFEDEEIENKYQEIVRASRSESAQSKDRKKSNEDDLTVHSFRTLLEDLGTICVNKVECNFEKGKASFETITRPTRLQQKALDLVGISLICTQ
jgi:transposase